MGSESEASADEADSRREERRLDFFLLEDLMLEWISDWRDEKAENKTNKL